ncbi:MAG TPA: ATP-dependent helicase HrpB [Micromonosporaceae bacterium]|nr:ATP-dependent helicase HrpB [Micromonosporaceae bacterium]
MLPDPDAVPGADLPVRAVLGEVVDALRRHGTALLVAPPGTGKTTLAPLALAGAVTGRVIVAEPRRVAARAAANRMAALLGERVGATVGYAVRGERRTSAGTRIEVVTTGVLVQRLKRDPELQGVDVVVLDECHERHLDTDLALAFLLDVRGTLRPDLQVLATSATADAERLAETLGAAGHPAPTITTPSALYPVDVVWCPPARPVRPPEGLWVDPRFLDHVGATVRRALAESTGDLLVFLPGAGEITAVAGRIGDLRTGTDVAVLHGRLPAAAQDAALRPGSRRRVVLATAVAESSLTVPGVRVVVDAGLARVPRFDLARGLGSLATVRLSEAAARQRAGRAGREAPGQVYRCWSATDHERLAAHAEPEVAVADLTGFALALACWGHPDGTGLALPDQPPAAAMEVAAGTLLALGAVDGTGRVTPRGRSIAAVGASPRLGRALLDGAGAVGVRRAAEVVALLSDDTLIGSTDDLVAGWRRLRDGTDRGASARWRDEVRRLGSSLRDSRPTDAIPDDLAAGLLVGLAFPERLAQARQAGSSSYLMAGGTAADLPPGSALTGNRWLAIAVADRAPGRAAARVRVAAPIDEATAREAGAALLASGEHVVWSGGDVIASRVERLGAIVLVEQRLARPDQALVEAAVRDGLRREGLEVLRWSDSARSLRYRLAFCRATFGETWPDVSDRALVEGAEDWLGPELRRARGRSDLARIDVTSALRRLLPWQVAGRLDELAPERLAVPSGSRVAVDYRDPAAPLLAVKVQEAFGWAVAPTVGGGRVPVVVHLLSPAGRPVAVTRDLASFWRTGYPQVRAELRGRYPRHPWPEDPTTAPPTRRLQPRRG